MQNQTQGELFFGTNVDGWCFDWGYITFGPYRTKKLAALARTRVKKNEKAARAELLTSAR